jgi:hypothetical protein
MNRASVPVESERRLYFVCLTRRLIRGENYFAGAGVFAGDTAGGTR